MRHTLTRSLGVWLAVAAGYLALALLGGLLTLPGEGGSPIWPAAGFALASLLTQGIGAWPGVWLGAVAYGLWLGTPIPLVLAGALGPTLQAVLGAWLTRRLVHAEEPLRTDAAILRFLLLGGPVACLLSASWVVGAQYGTGSLPEAQVFGRWQTWWSGDVLGVLLITPAALALWPGTRRLWPNGATRVAAPLAAAALFMGIGHVWHDRLDRAAAEEQTRRAMMEVRQGLVTELPADLWGLESLERLFAASQAVTRDEFLTFSDRILQRPGLLAVEWLPRVEQRERQDFEAELRRMGATGGIVERSNATGLVAAGRRSEYFPVARSAPASGQSFLGLDRSLLPTHRAAMAAARDSGVAAASTPDRLLRTDRPGVYVFVPHYRPGFDAATADVAARRAALRGFVAGVYDLEALYASLTAVTRQRGLSFRVTDREPGRPPRLLAGDLAADAAAAWTEEIAFAGRHWWLELGAAQPPWHSGGTRGDRLFHAGLVLAALALAFSALSATARVRVLATSENRFRTLAQNLDGMLYRCRHDPGGTLDFASDGCRELLGVEPADLAAGHPTFASLIHPDDSAMVWELVEHGLAEHQPFQFEYRVHHADGSWRWVWEKGSGVYDASGKLLHIEGFITDITAGKLAEQAHHEAASNLQATVEAIPDLLFELDENGRYLNVWANHPELLAGQRERLLGRTVAEMLPPEAASTVMAALREAGERGQSTGQQIRLPLPQGEHWFELSTSRKGQTVDGLRHFIMLSRDISDRKQAELALRRSEGLLSATLDALSSQIALIDEQGVVVATNLAWREFAQAAVPDCPRPMVGENYLEICEQSAATGNADAARVVRAVRMVAGGHQPAWAFEYACHSTTQQRWFYCRVTRFAGDGAAQTVVAHEDINAIRYAQAALISSERNLRATFEQTAVGMAQVDPKSGRLLQANARLAGMLGYTPAALRQLRYEQLLHPDAHPENRRQHARLRAGEIGDYTLEARLLTAGGQTLWASVTASLVRETDGQILHGLVVVEDISERRRLDQTLQGLNTPLAGEEFFAHLAGLLAEQLGADVVFVSEFAGNRAQTRFLSIDGRRMPALAYDLAGTPCGEAGETDVRVYTDDVAERFPADHALLRLGARAWAGATLRDRSGRVLGVVGILRRRPIEQPQVVESVLRLVALRSAGELEREAHHQALRDSEEKYRRLVENLGTEYFFYSHDAAGNLTYVSPSVEAILGYSRDEFQHHHRSLLTDSPLNVEAARRTAGSVQGITQSAYEVESRCKGGGRVVLEVTEVPILDRDGQVVAVEGIAHDITVSKRDETRLREAEQLFRATFEHAGVGIVRVDREHRILMANQAFCALVGQPLDALLGSVLRDLIDAQDRPQDVADAEEVWTGKAISHTREKRYLRPAGKTVWVQQTCSAVTDVRGQTLHLIKVVADIQARRSAEDRLRELADELEERVGARTRELELINLALATKEEGMRSLVDHLVDGVVHIDSRGIIRSANPAIERILGYERHELVGRNVSTLMPEPHRSAHDGYITRYLEGGPARIIGVGREVEGLHRDGEVVPLELSVNAYRAHGEVLFTGTLRDIREQKRIMAELRQARDAAESANRAKSAFLATMSHEIRTPMNGVIGMVELLAQGDLHPRQREMLHTVRDSSFSLLRIIDDILDFSKLEAGKLVLEEAPLSLESLVEGVCDALEPVAWERGVDLYPFVDPALPATLVGDAVRLRQVLNNLTGNAIKFSGGGEHRGRVRIRAESRGTGDGRVEVLFQVSDNGIGLSAAQQAGLFQPFTQADSSTTRRFGGTGLGLSIVRRIVDLMHGDISVESAPGEGATFKVRVPLALPATGPEEPPEDCLAGVECLLISADNTHAHDLAAYLVRAGAGVQRSPDPAAALRTLSSRRPAGHWVIVHDTGLDRPSPQDVQTLRGEASEPHLLLLLNHGMRHRPRLEAPGVVSLDLQVLHRRTLLEAVALAAGLAPASAADRPAAQAPATPYREDIAPILVADDNETNRIVVGHQLDLLGYPAEFAEDGAQALARWQAGSFSLILTDLDMPVMDGYGLAAAIRRDEPPGRRVPIVAFTANILQEERERCRVVGMDDFLTKPVQLHVLKATVERWIPLNGPSECEPPEDGSRAAIEAAAPAPDDGETPLRVEVLEQLVGDDPEIVNDFLANYRGSARQIAGELTAAWEAGELAGVGAMAHKLKSSSRSVGALPLGETCAQIEAAGKAGDRRSVAALLERFESQLAAVLAAIEARGI